MSNQRPTLLPARLRLAMASVASALLLGEAAAQTYTNAFNLGFSRPLWMEEIPTRDDHYLVMEQVGTAQVVKKEGAAWTKTQFMSIPVAGGTSGGDERGLLGFAFHPQYAANRKYYVYYFSDAGGQYNVLEERLADATLLKDAGKSKDILRIADYAGNHNGGTIRFGADGYLYLGTGDGGDQGDPRGNGQNKNSLLAKMLRIDVNKQENGKPYAIPPDNPYAGGGGAPEVYAYGLRNPYKWAFDPVTKDLWVADVGGGYQEEVNRVEKGGNYGWVVSEGDRGVTGGIKGPAFSYGRDQGSCIIGGYVFRGNPASKFYGQFIVGDHGSRNMWAVKADGSAASLARPANEPRGWGTDRHGRLYLMAGTTTVYRLEGADWNPATTAMLPREGGIKQAIGCIFACKPGARLADAAFAAGVRLEILSLSGERKGLVDAASREVPAGLQAGMYILKAEGAKSANGAKGAKPDLLMVQ